jgi:hypothetical protein
MAKKCRAERRNEARENKVRFPWSVATAKVIEAPAVRPNKRDRSPEAEERRAAHVTMDFTDGAAGISRAIVQHKLATVFPKKPKRGWAAKRRRAPFETFLKGDKLEKAQMRHRWYRQKIAAEQARELLAAE